MVPITPPQGADAKKTPKTSESLEKASPDGTSGKVTPKEEVPMVDEEVEEAVPEVIDDNREVDEVVLKNWLRRARRKFWHGVVVVKVTSLGKLVRRVIYVGAKPEYFEISSAKLFDIGYHLSDVDEITLGNDSPDFQAFFATSPPRSPKAEKSCVVHIESRPMSLVFKTESDRRDFVFLMRVELRAVRARYAYISQKFEDRRRLTAAPMGSIGNLVHKADYIKSNDSVATSRPTA
eukprot:Lankesteria_metandrocarpae@DN4847_c1_g1_i1.p1